MTATLRHDSNCVDVGAHRGAVLEQMVRLAPAGRHLAFEPIPTFCQTLCERFPKVEVHGCALADVDGETTFHVAENPELSGIQQREWLNTGYDSIEVPVRTLDSVVAADRQVDFLKIDVEGAQVLVLRGAERILSTDRPAIWVEHGARSASAHGTESHELWEILSLHGYRMWTADGEGPLDLPAFLSSGRDKPMWTFMAHR